MHRPNPERESPVLPFQRPTSASSWSAPVIAYSVSLCQISHNLVTPENRSGLPAIHSSRGRVVTYARGPETFPQILRNQFRLGLHAWQLRHETSDLKRQVGISLNLEQLACCPLPRLHCFSRSQESRSPRFWGFLAAEDIPADGLHAGPNMARFLPPCRPEDGSRLPRYCLAPGCALFTQSNGPVAEPLEELAAFRGRRCRGAYSHRHAFLRIRTVVMIWCRAARSMIA